METFQPHKTAKQPRKKKQPAQCGLKKYTKNIKYSVYVEFIVNGKNWCKSLSFPTDGTETVAMAHTLTKLKVILNSGVDSVVMRVIRLSSGSIFMFEYVCVCICARVYHWIFIEFVDSRLLLAAGKMPGQFNPLLRKYNIAFDRLVFSFSFFSVY